ncbi:MAG TPA: hypothetical protein VE243_03155 [Candidatus Acidoferrum sp.]|nr:hypothetical protein [Candidatus Acidoferrum sp.]
MRAKLKRRILVIVVTCATAAAGCHQETQQQKFIDAMNHGNGAQANQIWLHMDAKSRQQFAHSQGMQPNVAPDEVQKQVMQHYQDEVGDEDSQQTVERPAPSVHLGGLQSLPEWVEPSGAAPQAVTVPGQDGPSN